MELEDYFEIDFLDVESKKSGDAITIRYRMNGETRIHVVDGGFQSTGEKLVEHIDEHYDSPDTINSVVVTHPDGDHAGGIRTILEEYEVDELWMNRPWLYANQLIHRFSRFRNVENFEKRLREIYPNIAALEEIALDKGIPIYEPFQGEVIGNFAVLAPTKERYLELVVESEKTPESAPASRETSFAEFVNKAAKKIVNYVRSLWGVEIFSDEETSAENEMSVIQFFFLCEAAALLTGDAGRGGLDEAADFLEELEISLPDILAYFDVPHHGSRRNVSTEILDRLLGPRLAQQLPQGKGLFTAVVSASAEDPDHPRRAVIRALIHRGGDVLSVEDGGICVGRNKPAREGWAAAPLVDYPQDQEQ